MNFVLRMAWRDSRASRRRLALFSLSIVFGIAALVALGSFSSSLADAMRAQAKGLLGADLVVTSRAAPSAALRKYLGTLGGEESEEVSFCSMMVFPTAGGAVRLVRVRAMEGGFPFYGEFSTMPAGAAGRLRQPSAEATQGGAKADRTPSDIVILEDTLMAQFNVRIGDSVKLGRTVFTVIGALKKISGESLAMTMLAPRALVPLGTLAASGLDGGRSIAFHRVALKLPPGRDPGAVVRELKEKFGAERLSVGTVAERERELGRTLDNVDAFLSLVGFIALLLGAIGVAGAVHAYIRQKVATVAVLRCLGASARQSFGVYLAQGCALGGFGAILGAVLGVAVQLALPAVFRGLLPFPVDFSVAWGAVARGMAAGFVICVLFTILPLLAVRRISPLGALRVAAAEPPGRPDPWLFVILGLIAAAVAGFAIWQTRSVRVGLGFAGALGLSLGILAGLARLTAWAARRWAPRRLPYVARQGIANLHRPHNRTVLLILSLGMGTFLILTLYLTRTSLLREIEGAGTGRRPNLLLFDVQSDQIDSLDRLLAANGAPVAEQAPIVTMRISAIRGRPVEDLLRDPGGRLPAWTLRREYRSTFRGRLTATERLVAGEFVGRVDPGTAVVPISIEEGLANDMQLKLGDEVDWDVQGVPFRTRVAGIRRVEWRRLEPNFFVVFPEGALEDAPKFYVAAVRASGPAASASVQRAVVGAFPNVTAIDLELVLRTVDEIIDKVEFAIRFMALFTVGTGLVVLAGAVFNGHYQRQRETVLLRTLGATRRQIGSIRIVEYAALGALGAGVGAILALAASGLLARAVFHLPAAAPPIAVAVAVLATTGLAVATGWLADRGLLAGAPLEGLRAESR